MKRKLFKGGDLKLQLDQIHAADHLGDGMFHLDSSIHLHEVELVSIRVEQELHRSSIPVLQRLQQTNCSRMNALSCTFRKGNCRRLFHHLLVPTLQGTVTLSKVKNFTVSIAQYLHFNVARSFNKTLQIERSISECLKRFLR